MIAERETFPSAARAAQARSSFARLTELSAGAEPGQSVTNLSVGEQRHPVPERVAPIIAKHIPKLGRYPLTDQTITAEALHRLVAVLG